MRADVLIFSLLMLPVLTGCSRGGSNPWAHLDYAEAACGTNEAILTTTGCITSPTIPAVANSVVGDSVINPDDVNDSHNTDSNTASK